jgi:hypothetical protein
MVSPVEIHCRLPMENHKPHYFSILLAISAFLAGALIVFFLGTRMNNGNKTPTPSGNKPSANANASAGLRDVVTYSLPDAMTEATCPGSDNVYVLPVGDEAQCATNLAGPIRLALKTNGPTDCAELKPTQSVTKHTCSSLFIDGHKTLKAITEYSKTSSNNTAAYHVNTGKGVVSVVYTYASDQQYQQQFDELAQSIDVK